MLVTALSAMIGHDRADEIAKRVERKWFRGTSG
jgi:fumarate hydratase class II